MTELKRFQRQKHPKVMITPKVGDIVLIENENTKRHLWQVGIVTDLIKGRNNIVRGAVVKGIPN